MLSGSRSLTANLLPTATYNDKGIDIVSIGVQTFTSQDSDRDFSECTVLVSTQHISRHFQLEIYSKALAQVRGWSREFGIRFGIHSYGKYYFGGQPSVLNHLVSLGALEIELCIDKAWVMQINPNQDNSVNSAQNSAGHIYSARHKVFLGVCDGMWEDVVVIESNPDLKAFIGTLEASRFNDAAVIEYEANIENPMPVLAQCIETMRMLAG